MIESRRFEEGGISATLTNTVRDILHFDLLAARMLSLEESALGVNLRAAFLLIASRSSRVKGIDWQPPDMFADTETILASFERLLTLVDSPTLRKWADAVGTMLEPVSPPEDQGEGDVDGEGFLASAPPTSSNISDGSPLLDEA